MPIVLKHGFGNDMSEWLSGAAYIMSGIDRRGARRAHGNRNVILCYRGIKGSKAKRGSAPTSAMIPLVRQKSHLPLIADPSHSSGDRKLVERVALWVHRRGRSRDRIRHPLEPGGGALRWQAGGRHGGRRASSRRCTPSMPAGGRGHGDG